MSTYDAMTVRDKVGQMLMVGVPGVRAGDEAKRLIDEYRVGGIILFAENVESPTQVAKLNGDLQQMAHEAGLPGPLFIAIDQEGGSVARIRDGFTPLPSAMAIGAAGSSAWAEAIGAVNGAELAAVGVNMNAAPVLDVNNNPHNPVIGIRSFGEDPQTVTELGLAYMRGMQRQGMLATVKHFPGHGDTNVDSHFALPEIRHTRRRLDEIELVPFRAAIAEGVDAVMGAHITFPEVDATPGLPSTLSRRVLTDLLRDELGFTGLIITDALEMKGVAAQHRIADAALMAIEAGADIALIAQSQFNEDAVEAIELITEAVNEGRIPMERIDASLSRIVAAKNRLAPVSVHGANSEETTSPGARAIADTVRQPVSVRLTQQVARHAVTVVRNEGELLPLDAAGAGRMLIIGPEAASDAFRQAVKEHPGTGAGMVETVEAATPTDEVIEHVLAKAREADTVFAITSAALNRPEQARLVQALHDEGCNLVVIAAGAPYDVAAFPKVQTYVAAYGAQPLHMEAAAAVLFGAAEAKGRLPVTIPDLHPLGHGLAL